MITIHHRGEQFRGDPVKLLGLFEARAYKAERENNYAEANEQRQTAHFIRAEFLDGGENSPTHEPRQRRQNGRTNRRDYGDKQRRGQGQDSAYQGQEGKARQGGKAHNRPQVELEGA